jgi:fermentation-respiration switch protein FrsA (DUF1100 family)
MVETTESALQPNMEKEMKKGRIWLYIVGGFTVLLGFILNNSRDSPGNVFSFGDEWIRSFLLFPLFSGIGFISTKLISFQMIKSLLGIINTHYIPAQLISNKF